MRAPRFSNREAGSDLAQHEPSLTPLLQDWVAGLRRLLKDTQHGCFSAKPGPDRTQRPVLQMAAVCSAILEGGALHVAAARCHAEMLIFLLVTDEDAQLNEQIEAWDPSRIGDIARYLTRRAQRAEALALPLAGRYANLRLSPI